MTCSRCPDHCPPSGSIRSDPRLAFQVSPPTRGGGNGRAPDAYNTFYKEFARVYRLARKHYPTRPAVAILAANPGTTSEQVKWWRRKAVAAKFLDPAKGDSARPDRTAAAAERREDGPESIPADELRQNRADMVKLWRDPPSRVRLSTIQTACYYPDHDSTRLAADQLVARGQAVWDEDLPGVVRFLPLEPVL